MSIKHVFIIIILIGLYTILHADYYQNNGVYYFHKPAKEITGYTAIRNPEGTTVAGGCPVLMDSLLIIPTTCSPLDTATESYSIIYTYNINKKSIQDSVVIKSKFISRICVKDKVYLLGKKGKSKLLIITSDKKLNLTSENTYDADHDTNIVDAAIIDHTIYILVKVKDQPGKCLCINLGNMNLVRSIILPKNVVTSCIYNNSVYYIEYVVGYFRYSKKSLLNTNVRTVSHIVPYKMDSNLPPFERGENLEVFNDKLVFSYRKSLDFDNKIGVFHVVMVNLSKNSYVSKTLDGATCSLLYKSGSLYAFKSIFMPSSVPSIQYQVLTLTELDEKLSTENELITFFPSEWNYAAFLVKGDQDNLLMVGRYQTTGKKPLYSIFITDYSLK